MRPLQLTMGNGLRPMSYFTSNGSNAADYKSNVPNTPQRVF
jgi:hypothetical protein